MANEREKVRSFIQNNYPYTPGVKELKNDDSLMDMGILDSTAVLEMLEFLEETFEIRIEDEEVTPENLETINRISDFIQKKVD